MPEAIQDHEPGVQKPIVPIQKSPAFNTMTEKLESLMAPFNNTAPPPEKQPEAAPAEVPKPATTAPAPAPDKESDEELPESVRKSSSKVSEEFKKIFASRKQARIESDKLAAQIKTYEAEIAKLKTLPPSLAAPPAELEALKKEREELSDQLKAAAIERHPSFRAHFETRTSAAIEKAKTVIGDVADKAAKIAGLPPSDYRTEQLDKMMTEIQDVSPTRAVFLSELIRDISAISFEREAQLKKARTDYEFVQKAEADKAEASKAEFIKQRDQISSLSLQLARELDAFKRGDNAELNKAVDDRENTVKAFFNNQLDPKVLATIPGLAMQATFLTESVIPALREENAKLAKQIAEMSSSSPRPNQTSSQQPAPIGSPGRRTIDIYKANAPAQR